MLCSSRHGGIDGNLTTTELETYGIKCNFEMKQVFTTDRRVGRLKVSLKQIK